MTTIASLQIQVNSSQVVQATHNLNTLASTGGSATQSMTSLGSATSGAMSIFRTLAPVIGGLSFAKLSSDILSVNREFQSLRTSLETVTGSAKNAGLAFEAIQDFAAKTPYDLKQATEAFIKLRTLGLDASEKAMRSYGNTASAMGKSLSQMIEAVADATTGEFERLKEFGIKASKQGEQVSFTFQGITTTVKNSSDEITEYLQKIGNVNFAGGMDRQAQTINGALSNLGDNWDKFLDHIINSNGENAIAQWVQTAANALNKLDNWLNGPSTIKGKIAELDSQIAAKIDQVQANKNNGMIGGLIDDLMGFDANKTLNQVDALQKKRAEMVAESAQSQKQLSEITQGRVAAQSAENKALGEKFDLENRLKNLLDGQYKAKLINEARRQGLDPNIALTVASLETNSGTGIKSSPKGAQGLLQIMPGTAQDLTKAVGLSVDQILHTIDGNIKAGVAYLKQQEIALAKQGKASLTGILASYNAGRGNFLDGDYLKFKETQDYVKHGKQIYDALSEAAGGVEKFTQAQAKGKEETFKAVTSQERLLAATLEAEDLRNRGLVSQAGYNQLLLDAQSAYDKLSEKTFNAITPGEQLNETLNKLKNQLSAGEISQAGFTLEQERAIKSYQDATGITESYTLAKAAEEKQQKAVNDALKQYNDLQAINAGIQDQAQFADQLADIGFSTDQIKQQLDIYKQINEAVKQNPLLDPGQVQEMTFARIQGELQIQETTRTEGQKSIDIVSQAWEQSVKNMQTSLSNGIKGVLTGDALNSFKAFADNLKNTLYDAISNALSAGLIDGFKNNDWLSVGKSALMIGLSSLGGLLSKSSPTASAPSKALSAATGTGAMSIADIQSRGAGYEFASASVKQFNQDIKSITNAGLSLTNQIMGDFGAKLVESIASKAGSWASSFAGAAKSLSTTAGNAIAGIGSIYTLFDYFSNLGSLLDSGNVVRIAGQTLVAAGAVVTTVTAASSLFAAAGTAAATSNPAGWIAGAVLAIVGGVMSLLSKERIPNNWQNTFNPLQSQENPNRSNAAFDRNAIKNVYIDGKVVTVGADGTYYSTGNKSATAGVVTEFGATQFSSHEMKQSIESIKGQFGGLLGIIREFDGTLSKAVGSGAMQFYSQWLGDAADNTIKFKQNAQDLDTGAMLFDRYDRIINKLAESGDAKAQTVNVWFDALMSKFSKTDANFEQLVLSVVGGISNNIEQFAQMPASLAKLVVDSVKGTSAGASVKDVLSEASKVIGVYQAVNAGLSAMGASANQDAVVGFLASMNKISYSVEDAGSNLLAYADVLRIMGKNVDVAVAAQAKLNTLQQSGASNDLITAYFSSAGVIAQKLQTMGASFTDANLDATALHISNLAKASQETARNVVDHAIASEKLGDKSRESAIAILLSSKKLDEQTVKISEYSGAVAEFTKQQIEGLDFVQSILDGTGASFELLGIKTGDLVGVSDTLIKQYGSVAKAMEKHIALMKIAFGDEAVKSFTSNQAYTEQQRILARNPGFAAYGLYAGMNSENLQAANIAASKALGKPLNEIVAATNAFLAVSPDLQQFIELAGAFDSKTATGETSAGYKPNYTFASPKTTVDTSAGAVTGLDQTADQYRSQLIEFNTRLAELNSTGGELGKTLAGLQVKYTEYAKNPDISSSRLNDWMNAEMRAVFKPTLDEFNNIGKTDYQKNLQGITDWASEMVAVAPQIAQAYGITTDEALGGIYKIRDARIGALNKELETSRKNLSAQILTLEGDSAGALAIQRQLELDALDESLKPLKLRVYALEDEKSALEKTNTRRGLEAQILTLQGDSVGALAINRQIELSTLDKTLIPLKQYIYALEDQKAAQEKANKLAAQDIEILSLTGNARAATLLQRNQELMALEDYLRPGQIRINQLKDEAALAKTVSDATKAYNRRNDTQIQNELNGIADTWLGFIEQIRDSGGTLAQVEQAYAAALQIGSEAVAKAKKAITDNFKGIYNSIADQSFAADVRLQELAGNKNTTMMRANRIIEQFGQTGTDDVQRQLSLVQEMRGLIDERYNKEIENINKVKDAAKQIGSYLDKLKLGELSALTPEQKLAEARAQYQTQLAAANAGDAEAMGKVTEAADAFLNASRTYNASGTAYVNDFQSVQNALGGLVAPGGKSTDYAQMTAAATEESSGYLKWIKGVLGTMTNQQRAAEQQQLSAIDSQAAKIADAFSTAVDKVKTVYLNVSVTGTSDLAALNLGTAETLIKYAQVVVNADVSQDIKNMGLNILGTAQKYATMILTSDLDPTAKALKLADADTFVKGVWLSLTTTGTLTPAQQAIINQVDGQLKTTTLTQNVTATGTDLAQQIAANAKDGAVSTVNTTSVLTLDSVLNNSILSYGKTDVKAVYEAIRDNTLASSTGINSANTLLTSINNSLYAMHLTLLSINSHELANEQKLAGTLTVQSLNRTGALATFEKGGLYPGGLALVGEKGPELINFNRGGWVSTADQTNEILQSVLSGAQNDISYRPQFNQQTVVVGGNNKEQVEELKKQTEELKKQNAELKKQNDSLAAVIAVLQAGFTRSIDAEEEQAQSLKDIARRQRIAEAANG